jgi:DNA modification methylase
MVCRRGYFFAEVNVEYLEFLRSKMILENRTGFDVSKEEISSVLFPHQRDIVQWALIGGRRAIFASFGLGKSLMQLEINRQIFNKEGGKCLIVAPLGVRQEFTRDGKLLDMDLKFIRWTKELDGDGFYITNYESIRDGRLDVNEFKVVCLDEASVLRSYGSKTYQSFLDLFQDVKYRFVATATPSPNRYKELIHYAGFLGILDTGQALTRFFQRDSTKANNLTLHPHHETEFWYWLNSWAIFLQRPSDLGYCDDGYVVPKVHIHYHEIPTGVRFRTEKTGQMNMFNDAALSLSDASREKRNSVDERIEKMMEIVGDRPEDNFIIWHDQEIERHAIKKALPACKEVFGSLDLDEREKRIIDFSDGKFQYLATKPVLSGSGCNFQRHCHNSIYLGIGFKFNDFIQSFHRIVRFLQDKECHVHVIYTDTEKRVLQILKEKWDNHNIMVDKMSDIIKKHGLSTLQMMDEISRGIGCSRVEVAGKNYVAVNNDCVEETRSMPENSVDLIHTSIPFANHYEYTPSYNDFGHTQSNSHFWQQMDFLTPHLFRVLNPGRIAAIHIKDRILFGNVTGFGFPTCDNMLEETSLHFQKHGFKKIGIITIVTDVVRENNQTYRLGWTEQCKDGSKMGVGCPEYILIFRKPPTDLSNAYADKKVVKKKCDYHECPNCGHHPIAGEDIKVEAQEKDPLLYGDEKRRWFCNKCETYQHFESIGGYSRSRWQIDAHAFWKTSGDRLLSVDELVTYPPQIIRKMFKKYLSDGVYDYETHVKIGEALDIKGALPSTFMLLDPPSNHPDVWIDVNRMRTLNGNQKQKNLTTHICPLQIDTVDRIIERYSNKGDLVYDPFGGLATVPYRAVIKGRKGKCCELNPGYFADSLTYLNQADNMAIAPTLFDCEVAIAQDIDHN